MTLIELLACAGMIIGFFLLIGLKPMEFTDGLFRFLTNRPRSIKDEINEATKRKKPSFLRKEILEAKDILAMTGRSSRFSLACACSLLLFAIGSSIAIVMGNFFLAPVMAVGFMFLPFWYIKLTANHFKKDIAAELETALSIITTAYLRNEDILTAVEENLHYLNPPVQSVFKDFLMQIKLVNPDVDAALKNLRTKIDNEVFQEWCDAIADCQYDRSLKTTLTPIVSKLSDVRIVNGELDNLVSEPRKEFIIMVVLVVSNIPLMYALNKSWYDTLMHTPAGQVILAITAALIFISTAFVIKLTKPIEYRR
jgi:Flp pilus assembly protein TadB